MKIFRFISTGLVLTLGLANLAVAQAQAPAELPSAAVSHAAVCPKTSGVANCHARVVTDRSGHPVAGTLPSGYGPNQFRTAYGLTGSASTTIGIVDAYDDPNIFSDLNTYNSTYSLPNFPQCSGSITTSCFQKVDQRGGTNYPQVNAGWALEISLDVEAAHAACPNCKIVLVEADSNSFANLMAAENRAAALGAHVISNSWGGSEFSGETGSAYDGQLANLANAGIAITFSSGDNGYGVEYPAASPYVTAVGGTTLNLNANNTRSSESVWSGAGSGCSAYENQPAFQTALGLSGCSNRMVADVSADANPSTGAAVYDSVRYQGRKGWFIVGGTSLAAPLIASVYALSGHITSSSNSLPYNNTGSLFDITSGSNGTCTTAYLCKGTVGYDGPTGLGSPNGTSAF